MLHDFNPTVQDIALHRFVPIYVYLEQQSEAAIQLADSLLDDLIEMSDSTTIVRLPVLAGSWAGGRYARTRKRRRASDHDAEAQKFAGAVASELTRIEGARVAPGPTIIVQPPGETTSGYDRIISRLKELVALSTSVLILAGSVWIFAERGKGTDSGRDKVTVTCMNQVSQTQVVSKIVEASDAEDIKRTYQSGATGPASGMSCTITLPSKRGVAGANRRTLQKEVEALKKAKE